MNVSITGGSGFLGRHLISEFAGHPGATVRALAHTSTNGSLPSPNVDWTHGTLENADVLRKLMAPGGVFVNLAYPADWAMERHMAAAEQLGRVAREVGIKRFVHCSTAIVVGNTASTRVTETTPCEPVTAYERSKLEIERKLTDVTAGAMELVILRPTAIFGPYGQNLVQLARALTTRSRAVNYLRSSLFGRRTMNLVCLDNVVAALRFLAEYPGRLADTTYLVSDDDDPENNFHDIEAALMTLLGVTRYPLPQVRVPTAALTIALRAAGRPSASARRTYDMSRLFHAGFARRATLAQGLERFADWFRRAQ